MLLSAKLVPQSSTKVCVKCYDEANAHYNTRWLPWLECAHPKDHAREDRITLIVGDDHEVVEVIELPSSLLGHHPSKITLCRKNSQPEGCPDGYNCKYPHSDEELEYWKWTIVQKQLEKVILFPQFHSQHTDAPVLYLGGYHQMNRLYILNWHLVLHSDCMVIGFICTLASYIFGHSEEIHIATGTVDQNSVSYTGF